VLSNEGSASVAFEHDKPPVLVVTSPVDEWEVARPGLHLAARCTDDGPDGCTVEVVARVNASDQGTTLLSAPSGFDQTISLAAYEAGTLAAYPAAFFRLSFVAKDSRGQTSTSSAWAAVESSPALVPVDKVNGFIYDADATRILYMDWRDLAEQGRLRLRNRSTRDDVDVATVAGGGFYEPLAGRLSGYATTAAQLTTLGAIYHLTSNRYAAGVWDFNGTSTNQIEVLLVPSVAKRGDYALWDGFGDGSSRTFPWPHQFRSFAQQKTTELARTGALAPNGDVLYADGGNVWRLRNGMASQLTTTGTVTSSPIASDGLGVLYVDMIQGVPWLILLDSGGTTTQIQSNVMSYDVNNGWVVFSRPGQANGPAQVWRRSPDGSTKQITPFGAPSTIVGLSPDGATIVSSGGRRYLSVPGGPPIPLDIGKDPTPGPGFDSARGVRDAFIDGAWHTAIGGTLFRIYDCGPAGGPGCPSDAGVNPDDSGAMEASTPDASAGDEGDAGADISAGDGSSTAMPEPGAMPDADVGAPSLNDSGQTSPSRDGSAGEPDPGDTGCGCRLRHPDQVPGLSAQGGLLLVLALVGSRRLARKGNESAAAQERCDGWRR
jgi:hypothetical protein